MNFRLSPRCGTACLVALALLFSSPAVRAQSDTGAIRIDVVDATTAKPIGDARTILLGPQMASSLTTAAGVIQYTDVPVGIYRVRVVRSGYAAGVSAEFDVLPNRAVNVRVALGASNGGLKVIGSVTARSNVTIDTNDINDASPIRRLSDSLTDALDKVAGVSVTQDATDPSSPVTVSLGNRDESQTAITLDGIPLSAPGSSANLRSIGTDLFSGSSVSNSPSAGALGGGVNFRTLQPTQSLQLRANGTTGTFDRSNYQIAATGSAGNLGLALQHTWRGSNSPLTFQDYRDQSGLTYPHEGESHNLGDFIKFRYRLGDERTTLSGTALSNNTDTNALCARDVTLLPCGIGPGNSSYGRSGFAYATLQSLVGTVATTVSAYESSGTQNTDNINRYVLLPAVVGDGGAGGTCGDPSSLGLSGDYTEQLCPSIGDTTTLTRGVAYSASIARGRHTFALGGTTYASRNVSTPTAGSRFETGFVNAIASSTYQLADAFKASDTLTLSPRVSVVNTTTLGTSLLGGFGATWRPRAADTFGASASAGSSQANSNLNRSFSDPVSTRFDCGAGTAVVSGPGDTNGGAQSAVSFDASWTHQFARSGAQFALDGYSQVQSGQLINALIAEPSSYFPSGYVAAVNAAYRAQTVCGASTSAPILYATVPVGGTRRIYRGLTASGRIGIGRYFVALPNYTLNVAKLTAAGSRLADGASTTIVGEQLPNRPIHRAGVTFDGLLPRSGTEVLLNAQYTGANNQQNLGPYALFAAGISHGFGPGRVTLFENNIFNTYGGVFVTDANAQTLPLSDGATFRAAATPLTPRVLSLSYTLLLGGPRPGPALAAVVNGGSLPAPSASAAPARGPRFVPVPPPPGVDPLSLASGRPSCDAEARNAAAPTLEALRAYVAAYEGKTKLPEVPNLDVVPHAVTLDRSVPYYLELHPRGLPNAPGGGEGPARDGDARSGARGGDGDGVGPGRPAPGGPASGGPGGPPPGGAIGGPPSGGPGGVAETGPGSGGRPSGGGPSGGGASGGPANAGRSPQARAFRGFAGCTYLTVLTSADAKAKGITTQGGRPGLFYVPTIGFVFVRPPELPQGGGSLKPAT